jgi:hypothetical protein
VHLIQIPCAPNDAGVSPLATLWPIVSPLLAPSIERGDGATTLDYEYQQLAELRKQLWVIVNDDGPEKKIVAAGVSSLNENPGGMFVANMEMIGGADMKTWFDLKGQFEDWAKTEGCNEIRLYAAKGWAKHLPDYKITAYVMSKKI